MINFGRWLAALAVLGLGIGPASAQVTIGTVTGVPLGTSTCSAITTAPRVAPEGYTELLGDIIITCTGGPLLAAGAQIPQTNITVSTSVPFTSRLFNSDDRISDVLLLINEPGSSLPGPVPGFGPYAPQSLCTTPLTGCVEYVNVIGGLPVAVSTVGATTSGKNVYQGVVGDPDASSNQVTFRGVPVLPPVYGGYGLRFRITNLRVSTVGLTSGQQVLLSVSVSNATALPLSSTVAVGGTVDNPLTASIDSAPSGGQHPFSQCVAPSSPALTAKLSFTEGFPSMFKTRVVPLSDTAWASTTPNTGTPGQNIPGGLYSGTANNSQSGFILPAATATVNSITYTAGLADFGTRLKAVFTNIPSGINLYVSTSNASGYAIPGGQSTVPYAVLVASSPSNEAKNDGAVLTPLTTGAVTGSDGLTAYPLTPDASGTATAIWEVVNANQAASDTLTFSVYVTYTGTPSVTGQSGQPVNNVALSLAPEPGGGTFTLASASTAVSSPLPRFSILAPEQSSWVSIAACTVDVTGSSPVAFSYTTGGAAPASQTVTVTPTPSDLSVTATPVVTTPDHGTWLSGSLSSDTLTVSVNPAGLAASATAYAGNVKLTATGVSDVLVPVTLTVYPAAALTISKTHTGNFTQGQTGASYSITVANGASAGPSTKTVTVTESVPTGMTLVSMAGTGWNCATLPNCTRSNSLAAGSTYPAITATVNVAANAAASLTNSATLSGEVSSGGGTANDPTTITQLPDLTITTSHSGNFTQGQTGAQYSVTVTNSGTGPVTTSNTVTVVDTLPSGLTATAISGTNWNCTVAALTCTRADALAAGASYPAITLTVNVSATAPSSVTNSATVSGGGEINTANDAAADTTAVLPPVSVTVGTSPSGLSFTVDAVTYTSAHTFQWAAGSAHNIGTTTPQSSLGQPFNFSAWSDGGAIVHSISPSTAATYTATFAAVTQSEQTISFPPIPDKTFGDPPFALSATASSGLPVSFGIISGPATISGNIITLTGTGTVAVVASQAGNSAFTPAETVLGSFRVLSPRFSLTLAARPGTGGTITATPSGGVYASGATVQVTAQPNRGFIFTGFSGDLSGATNPQSVVMLKSLSVTANFVALSTVPVDRLSFGFQTGDPLPGPMTIPLNRGWAPSAVTQGRSPAVPAVTSVTVTPGTGGNWLTAALTPVANPSAVQLSLDASVANGLTTGTYLSYVVITTASGQRVVTVKLLVNSVGVDRVTDSAGYQARDPASDEWLTIFGINEATQTAQATSAPGQTSLAGTSVTIQDSAGVTRSALLSYVSPTQINLLTPSGMAPGAGVLTVVNGRNQQATVSVTLGAVSPGLFSADSTGQGVAAAVVLQVAADGSTKTSPAAGCESSGTCPAIPIDVGDSAGKVYLSLYGTGIRGRSALSQVTVTIAGVPVQVLYAGAQSQYPGLDQINVLLPAALAGKGYVRIVTSVDGQAANTVCITLK